MGDTKMKSEVVAMNPLPEHIIKNREEIIDRHDLLLDDINHWEIRWDWCGADGTELVMNASYEDYRMKGYCTTCTGNNILNGIEVSFISDGIKLHIGGIKTTLDGYDFGWFKRADDYVIKRNAIKICELNKVVSYFTSMRSEIKRDILNDSYEEQRLAKKYLGNIL